jgi:hypothetical protein
VELSGPNGGPIAKEFNLNYSALSDAELATLAALLEKAMGGGGR